MKKFIGLMMAILLTLAGCTTTSSEANQIVNVYSSRNYDVDKDLLVAFEQQTGIKVNLIEGKGDELLERINREKANPIADVFITVGGEHIYYAQQNQLLMDLDHSPYQANVSDRLLGRDWVALTQRARVMIYDVDAPLDFDVKSYDDLANEAFASSVLSRSSTSSYNIALLAAMIQREGLVKAEAWAQGVTKNFAQTPTGNDRDQAKFVMSGLGKVAIMNTYYIARLAQSSDQEEVKVAERIGVIYPENTHMNISWAAMIKDSKNQQAAQKLIHFLMENEAQSVYATKNGEFPVLAGVELSPILAKYGEFDFEEIDYEQLGSYVIEAVKIFDRVGWN
ncbi:MAG TPA: Fe(3+) ABC transporter substrate-binding protein [Erysipelotrichaceae bacterium]|nr:Fe(3+) ABC transporter substrate-binding protein [Erysipelotrichaceae bacterium]